MNHDRDKEKKNDHKTVDPQEISQTPDDPVIDSKSPKSELAQRSEDGNLGAKIKDKVVPNE